ncbi:hypothetical protein RHMOL_Rhmol02G0141700 [Rhododendron molle]|uniref:Uncharacterized protein n=1 Tax=Rhododendron molle TaxID=49168 RepID=A0ACC0PPR5_RHOML|nr:hypothetical protein RHMOL_Rhmol02G0141700 [Rhododendron molle]
MAYATARPIVTIQTFDSYTSTFKDALPLPSVIETPPSHGASTPPWHKSEDLRASIIMSSSPSADKAETIEEKL